MVSSDSAVHAPPEESYLAWPPVNVWVAHLCPLLAPQDVACARATCKVVRQAPSGASC